MIMGSWPSSGEHECAERNPHFALIQVSLSNFGAFSRKSLVLCGTWSGISFIMKLREMLRPKLKGRELLKLTGKSGKWS